MSVHTTSPQPTYALWERLVAALIICIVGGVLGYSVGALMQTAPWVIALVALVAFFALVANRWYKTRGNWETLA